MSRRPNVKLRPPVLHRIPASCDLGHAIVFEFDEKAQRLDHFLAENGPKLDAGARLQILAQVADAIRYAHGKDVVHRALCPQAIYVLREKSGALRTLIYNWHTGARLPDGSFTGGGRRLRFVGVWPRLCFRLFINYVLSE